MTNTTINLVRYDGNGKGNGGAGVMGRLVGQATCMVSTWRSGRTDLKSVIAEMNEQAMNEQKMIEQMIHNEWMNERITYNQTTKDDKAGGMTTTTTTTLITTTTNKVTKTMMTMMTRWQRQRKPDWSTNTTINLMRYNSDGDCKGNGGAGVMGWPVGQVTCMVSTWRPGGTDLKSVTAEMNKLAMNKQTMIKQTIHDEWMNKRTTNEQTTKDDKAGGMATMTITTLMTTMTNKMTKNNDDDDDKITTTAITWLINQHNNQPHAIQQWQRWQRHWWCRRDGTAGREGDLYGVSVAAGRNWTQICYSRNEQTSDEQTKNYWTNDSQWMN